MLIKTMITPERKQRCKNSLTMIPYLFTFANALCGFLSVIESINGNFLHASLFIGFAAIMDLCDGRLARAFGSSSCLGAELDGLCDAISFCFAPVMLLFNYFDYPVMSLPTLMLGLYLCAGLFRLAKFNVLGDTGNPAYFSGLSTPVSAFFLSSIIVYATWFEEIGLKKVLQSGYNSAIVGALALLMISRVPFPSFKKITIDRRRLSYIGLGIGVSGGIAFVMQMPVIFLALSFYIFGSLLWAFYLLFNA